ncbi:MAG TPA: AAA domain-containing protein [Segeticoccus sp.]|uniref:AAA domain-containing protein n=1 Tax=Segeticoccus sp. TaxID=2706531 RepID=UPI002D7F8403|nr:AAA domain-containing protein [Segeticoccus sp.]HET8600053.1 AAA domain-containing protein [Segeticoccus sp.]
MSSDPQIPQATDSRSDRVAAAVRGWQRHLVDLGGRNTLLWYRDLPAGTLDLTTAHPGGLAMLLAGRPTRLSDLVREPAALEEARRRARIIRAKAVELHEERGVPSGFIAVGMATWEVPGLHRSPAAPVLLRTCSLRPIGPAQQDFDVDLGARAELNPVLVHYLRSEQGIEVDPAALSDLASATGHVAGAARRPGHGFDPDPVFAELNRACRRVPGFRIRPRLVVSTFSYAKLPMVADLAALGPSLADHDVVAALAGDRRAQQAVHRELPAVPPDADPARERLVLDADLVQQRAVEAARAGANLVVHGAPGTGKSQTIANLVAGLVADGKRVLVAAEKRAALDTLVGRLQRLGLGDLVLDPRHGTARQEQALTGLAGTLDRAGDAAPAPDTEVERTLADRRTRLVDHCAGLHEKREPWGVSAFDAQVALSLLGSRDHPPVSRVRLHGDTLRTTSRERMDQLGRLLAEAGKLGAWTTDGKADPWYGARVTTDDEADQALDIVRRLGSGGELRHTGETMDRLLGDTGLPASTAPADWDRALQLMGRAREVLDVFRPEVFDAPLDDLVDATASADTRRTAGGSQGAFDRMRLRRQARSLVRPGPRPADVHEQLGKARDLRRDWQKLAGAGSRPAAPEVLEEAQGVHEPVADDLSWLGERLAPTAQAGDLTHLPLDQLERRLRQLEHRADRLTVLPRVIATLDELRGAGLGELVDDLAARSVDVEDVPAEVEFVWWASLLADIADRDGRYGGHDGEYLRQVAEEYVHADHGHLDAAVDRVRATAAQRVREAAAAHPDQAELVRAAADGSGRRPTLRQLVRHAPDVLFAARPCWVVSPLVIASVLPAERLFDVVIFDEASQIATAQAVSAIARAGQVVVVGDEHQLAPTSFSTTAEDDKPAAEAVSPASLLDSAARILPGVRLGWHYRSMDERLFAFANDHVYGGDLVTFPGATGTDVVRYRQVNGASPVDEGGEPVESTDAEVSRVVDLVLSHARTRPQESLGVVTLTARHAARIDQALRKALPMAADAAAFFHQDAPERFFVKPADQVQGEERDVILLSVGYGTTPHGRVLHRFGALNTDRGVSLLTVATTRARREMTVVAAFTAADLDPERLRTDGVRMLRDLLAYAERGGPEPLGTAAVPQPGAASGPHVPTHPMVDDLARRLRAEGLTVHEDVGCSAHRIDLTVDDPRQPGRSLVAVETDGPSYGALASTRERDRLRPEQLRRLGWQHLRVWTTDIFRDPARDVARVTAAVWEASNAAADVDGLAGAGLPAGTGVGREAFEEDLAGRAEQASQPAPPPAEAEQAKSKGKRKRRFRRSDQTRDDTDEGWGERADESAHDRWLQEQRPPHWG